MPAQPRWADPWRDRRARRWPRRRTGSRPECSRLPEPSERSSLTASPMIRHDVRSSETGNAIDARPWASVVTRVLTSQSDWLRRRPRHHRRPGARFDRVPVSDDLTSSRSHRGGRERRPLARLGSRPVSVRSSRNYCSYLATDRPIVRPHGHSAAAWRQTPACRSRSPRTRWLAGHRPRVFRRRRSPCPPSRLAPTAPGSRRSREREPMPTRRPRPRVRRRRAEGRAGTDDVGLTGRTPVAADDA